MTEATNTTLKSTQEQAIASWITYLNQQRLDQLIERLDQQDIRLEDALKELNELKEFLADPAHILGNEFTKHGEIAEHMQVNLANARRAIQGLNKNHTFDGVGRTAPEDYIKDGQQIQSKFYNGLKQTFFNHHGLAEHLQEYPDFVSNGGSYIIPKDQNDKMVELLEKYKNNPSKLSSSDYHLAKRIDEFLGNNDLKLGKDINSSIVNYDEVQKGTANSTIAREEEKIKEENNQQRTEAYKQSQPSIKEGIKVTGISAVAEGGLTFCMEVARKRKEKKFSEFTEDDWKLIGIDTGKGALKGGIRGSALYVLTNFTQTPANVASAYVTAVFGISAQTKALERGELSQEDFLINCETICLDVTVSAISSLAGQFAIPIPIVGAVIGNVVGSFVCEICKREGEKKSQQTIENYYREIELLNQKLDIQYHQVIWEIQKQFQEFKSLEELAFDEKVNIAFCGSIDMARNLGVPESNILKNMLQIDEYFE